MRALAQLVALFVFVVGLFIPATGNARETPTAAPADEIAETWADVHAGATELANALCARDSPLAAGGGAKNLREAVGSKETQELVNQALKGKKPLSELTPDQRAAAAGFFREVSTRTKGKFSEAASEFNRLRADFLEGKTDEVPGLLRDFMKRRGISE